MKNTVPILKSFTKVKLGTASLKFAVITALAVMLGFAACEGDASPLNLAKEPTGVKIDQPANLPLTGLPKGGDIQLSAKVEPEGAPKALTWSIISPAQPHDITCIGGLLVANATEGTVIKVRATAKDYPTVFDDIEITVAAAVNPATVIVSPQNKEIAAGGKFTFTAAVGPEFAPKEVVWSKVSGKGTIDPTTGVLTVDMDADPGDTIVIRATAKDFSAVYGDSTITVAQPPQPITLTINDVPGDAERITIELWQGNDMVARGRGSVGEKAPNSVTASMFNYEEAFETSGTYRVVLKYFRGNSEVRHIPSQVITDGNNTIVFGSFTTMPSIQITVTGIPDKFKGGEGGLSLLNPTTKREIGWDDVDITGNSAVFSISGTPTGRCDVVLMFRSGEQYILEGMNVGATNPIQFNQFKDREPSIKLTVSGMSAYNGELVRIGLLRSGMGVDESGGQVVSGQAVFSFYHAAPGEYSIRLEVETGDKHAAAGITLTKNHTLALSSIPLEVPTITLTITGLNSHNGKGMSMNLITTGGQGVPEDYASVEIRNNQAVLRFYEAPAGTYDLSLSFFNYGGNSSPLTHYYWLDSQALKATNTPIPFSNFTEMAIGGHTLPNKSGTR
ncbi:MAG: hypothetical protein FWD91_05090 [Treponema sp.]|nr:hypothetical protein [Treponema sp.]